MSLMDWTVVAGSVAIVGGVLKRVAAPQGLDIGATGERGLHADHDAAWQNIGGMIANMIVKADEFCRSAH